MAISSLATYRALSPNHYVGRAFPITKITVHHMAGDLTVEQCGNVFASSARQASSNYGVGSDGRIACYVDEGNAAWTSANWDNDNRAVTIEVANDNLSTWSSSDAAYRATVELVADICRRNGIASLNYTGDASGNLTEHRMFAATACPGPWWHARMSQFASDVNKKLKGNGKKVDEVQPVYNPSAVFYKFYKDCSKSKLKAARHRYARTKSGMASLEKRGYRNEGPAWRVGGGTLAVYKMYNPSSGDTIFTVKLADAKELQGMGWEYRGVPFFACAKGAPVYRMYHSGFGQHYFTADKSEYKDLRKGGWKPEGVAFYVLAAK